MSFPVEDPNHRMPLFSPEFSADPHGFYENLRNEFGALAPVALAPDVPATLVLGYHEAVRILHDPDHFPYDPRRWQVGVDADCPVLPMMEWRPCALRSTGAEHARYRAANTASINAVDLHALHYQVEQIAIPLINRFCERGSADILAEYAFPLAFDAVNAMIGCPADIGERIAAATAAIFDGVDADRGNELLTQAMFELVQLKRAQPGDDITTRLLQHSADLDDTEMIHQLVVLYGAGIEPQQNLITNTMLLLLTDKRFAGDFLGGSMTTRDALDEVLFNDPPVANYCFSYPRQPILIDGTWLPANQPVVISMAAANTDPSINNGELAGNRSHLAWGAGPHACPARTAAYIIANDAIDQIFDVLPELKLAIPAGELTWRPGPFHRSLAELPVTFPPSPPLFTPAL